jgi:hypothetical protein
MKDPKTGIGERTRLRVRLDAPRVQHHARETAQNVRNFSVRSPVHFGFRDKSGQSTMHIGLTRFQLFKKLTLTHFRPTLAFMASRKKLLSRKGIHALRGSTKLNTSGNPRNGLCLNALHDLAFDRHLMWIEDGYVIRFSRQLGESISAFRFPLSTFGPLLLPKKFTPDMEFLKRHAEKCQANDIYRFCGAMNSRNRKTHASSFI